jgi:uncharacterized protein (DUF2141 family)
LALSGLCLIGSAAPGEVEVELAGLRSAKGVIRICLTRDARRFPECAPDQLRSVAADQPRIRFDGLPSGAYAVALFHDENRNARLDTMLGIPREGFGFSRNPPIGFGPPKFSAARFAVASGESAERVTLRYLL